jgi:spermidine synthase
VEVGVATSSYLLMYLYPELPYWYVWLFDFLGAADDPMMTWVASLAISGLVMTPPAVLMGIAFPVAVRAVVGHEGKLGGPVGRIYGINTWGGVVGAFGAGFIMLPNIQVQGTIFVACMANLVAAAVLFGLAARMEKKGLAWAAPLGILGFSLLYATSKPPWDPMLMTAGMYQYVSHFENHTRDGIRRYAIEDYTLLFYEEGLSSVVTVAQNADSENIWLANNGKVDASTTTDMPTQVLCSLLPMQFAERPTDVLVIGLASGVTAGALTLHPEIERLDIVELEPAIERAAKIFEVHNHGVLNDPRTNLIANDGRNHLVLTKPGTYDVIVSEPSNPWISGVSNLFTSEFFELGKSRLKPGGVWSQWVQMYGMDVDDVRTLLGTFSDTYEYVLVYATIEDADLVLVGSDNPIEPTLAAAEHLLRHPKVAAELALVDVADPLDLVALFQLDSDAIHAMSDGWPRNTDDNMRIEYRAPMNLHRPTHEENFKLLIKHASVPLKQMGPDPLLVADLARTYQARDETVRAIRAIASAADMLDEDDPLRADLVSEAEEWQRQLIEELEAREVADDEDRKH